MNIKAKSEDQKAFDDFLQACRRLERQAGSLVGFAERWGGVGEYEDYAEIILGIKDVTEEIYKAMIEWIESPAGREASELEAAGKYDVMVNLLMGMREGSMGKLQPIYVVLDNYIDKDLGRLKREGLTVGIEDSELDLVIYVHGVDAESTQQAEEMVRNQLERDGAIVIKDVTAREA